MRLGLKGARHLAMRAIGLAQKAQDCGWAFYWRLRLQSMGEGARISSRVVIYQASRVRLGPRAVLNDFVHIWAGGGVDIGTDSMIASHCVITSVTHDIDALAKGLLFRETTVQKPVKIGANVWIGSNAVILPGVSIGNDAVVGAGSVVTRDVPERSVVAGAPARVIRTLVSCTN
jgi:acetyltransferase-like isoleucine patch superfamily enzyme